DAGCLVHVGHRDRRDHVDLLVGEDANLLRMIGLRLLRAHDLARIVAVAARADAAAYHHLRARRLVLRLDVAQKPDRLAVGLLETDRRIAELVCPVLAGAPGRAFENEAHAVLPG